MAHWGNRAVFLCVKSLWEIVFSLFVPKLQKKISEVFDAIGHIPPQDFNNLSHRKTNDNGFGEPPA